MQQQLFSGTVVLFEVSLADQSMKKLLDNSSSALRQQVPRSEFNKNFAPFFQYADGYSNIANLQPVMDGASVDDETEVLTLRSHYPVTPSRVYFRQTYVYECIDWKLFGIELQVGSATVG